MSVSLHPCLRADINYSDYATKSSQIFCQLGDCENVQKILKRGVSPNRVGSFGWTALQEAAEESHSAVVSLLCLQGDLNFMTVKTVSSLKLLKYPFLVKHGSVESHSRTQ